jgi:hypothetical protein
VHPNQWDPKLGALAHGVVGDLGPGSDDNCIDTAGNAAQVGTSVNAFDLVRVRVDREYLVAAAEQATEHRVGSVMFR